MYNLFTQNHFYYYYFSKTISIGSKNLDFLSSNTFKLKSKSQIFNMEIEKEENNLNTLIGFFKLYKMKILRALSKKYIKGG